MAFEPTTVAAAVFSGLNALIKISQQSAQFVKVPDEIAQLRVNVHLADDAISTARRLQRENPARVLGDRLIEDVDRSVKYTEQILIHLRDSIEDCNKDLKTKKTVSVKNRAVWMLWKEKEFAGNLATLTNALTALNRDIGRLEIAVRASSPGLPSYDQVVQQQWGGGANFPRAPSMRRSRPTSRTPEPEEDDVSELQKYPDAVELEGSEPGSEEATMPRIRMPTLVHMMSAPDELPQTGPRAWTEITDNTDSQAREDVVDELRGWEDDDRYLTPRRSSTRRRRSDFV